MSPSLMQRLTQAAREEIARTLSLLCADIGAAESSILLPEGETHLVFFASTNPSLLQPSMPKVPINASFSGAVYRTGQTMAIADAAKQAHHFEAVDAQVKIETHEFAAVPLVERRVLGVLTLVNRTHAAGSRPFTLPELRRAETTAKEIAGVLAAFPALRGGEAHSHDGASALSTQLASELKRLSAPELRVTQGLVRALLQNRP
jgi:signal transduction protein with GAF and PtsI domain